MTTGASSGRACVQAAIILVLVTCAGCATGGFVRPTGTAVPSPEAVDVWTDLTRPCRDVTGYRAQIRVSGRVRGDRVPGLTAGLAVDADRIAMDVRYGATRMVTAAGRASDMTLLLYRDARVVRGPAADVVEAFAGVRLDPARLLAIVTGCVAPGREVSRAERIGSVVRIVTPDTSVYLRQKGAGWQLIAGEFDGMMVDYRRMVEGWPRDLVIRQSPDVELRFQVIEFERNPQLAPAVFRVATPDGFVETSVDTLREEGAFGRRRE